MSNAVTSTEERALALLGTGIAAEQVAAALGVTPSRISQLLSDSTFAAKVAELRFANLQSHNVRDNKYDTIEDKLLENLERSIPFLVRPHDILRAITVVNGAKRRGVSAPEQVTAQQTVINLVLPQVALNTFRATADNHVTHAGARELITIQSDTLLREVKENVQSAATRPAIGQKRAGQLELADLT